MTHEPKDRIDAAALALIGAMDDARHALLATMANAEIDRLVTEGPNQAHEAIDKAAGDYILAVCRRANAIMAERNTGRLQ